MRVSSCTHRFRGKRPAATCFLYTIPTSPGPKTLIFDQKIWKYHKNLEKYQKNNRFPWISTVEPLWSHCENSNLRKKLPNFRTSSLLMGLTQMGSARKRAFVKNVTFRVQTAPFDKITIEFWRSRRRLYIPDLLKAKKLRRQIIIF